MRGPADSTSNENPKDRAGTNNGNEPPRILIIDDDELALTVLQKLLEAENCAPDACSSVPAALAQLTNHHYDAIFCDMWIGEGNGKEFFEQVKKDFPEYQRRIIFITGDLSSKATWDFLDEEHLPYVLKPFSRTELHRLLVEILGHLPSSALASRDGTSPWDGADRRRNGRFAMVAKARVRRKKWAAGQPDIVTTVNASRDGIYLHSEREYRIGTEVWVAYPYTGNNDLEQEGLIVRVERTGEAWGVAIALGEAAKSARTKFAEADAGRQQITPGTGEGPSAPSGDAVPTPVAPAEEQARRLAEELTDLKATHDLVLDQRDRLASEEAALKQQLRQLDAARATMTQTVEQLRTQMDTLQKDLAAGEEYRYRATHDSLTGVWNRAAILDILKRDLLRAKRRHSSVGVLLADVDHFKAINDTYGHLAGDAVLRQAAQRLTSGVRAYDAVGRYGGEEFLIVLAECAEESVQRADRLRELISAHPVNTEDLAIRVTLSMGVAWRQEGLEDIEELLRAADAALYRAKHAGRNRVEAAVIPLPPVTSASADSLSTLPNPDPSQVATREPET